MILRSAQAVFPPSANKTVRVRYAWRASDDATGADAPPPNGSEGWTRVDEAATEAVVRRLQDQGYTWVNLQAGGTAAPLRDVPIAALL